METKILIVIIFIIILAFVWVFVFEPLIFDSSLIIKILDFAGKFICAITVAWWITGLTKLFTHNRGVVTVVFIISAIIALAVLFSKDIYNILTDFAI